MGKIILAVITVFLLTITPLRKVYSQEIEDVKQQFAYAQALLSAKQYQSATKEFMKVLYLYPENELHEEALFKITDCLMQNNSPWYALEQCQKFLEKYPNTKYVEQVKKTMEDAKKIAHTSLGYSEPPSLTLKDKVAQKYIEFGNDFLDNSVSQGSTGDWVYNNEKLKMAFYWFDKVINEFPESQAVAKAQYYKGTTHLKQERQADYNKAIGELQKVVDKYPDSMWADEALKKMGDIYKDNLVNKSRAIEIYQKLIDKKKDDPYDYYVSYCKAQIIYLK